MEEKKNPQEMIDMIIDNTFSSLQKCFKNKETSDPTTDFIKGNGESRLIFPMKRDESTRISEQELRFVFVEEFNKCCDEMSLNWFYSVETPTGKRYIFSESESSEKEVPRVADIHDIEAGKGESASFDLVIHDITGKRIALIEVKALNPDGFSYKKDFLKLKNDVEGDVLRFFVMILKNHDDGTIKSIQDKITSKGNVSFHCYSLEKGN